ncbi:hypothetical protein CHLV4142_03140 [Campylobacter helveticus]|uniref:Uncharacterized protein n=1 Tax=Campylobacter helveticus TaxID=28898 RepID=A0ABY3L4J6_9BACT|nr:hypothetical protein [Campylobacter helveticus]MCR2039137.1 hypothetical protein [Campylobacter helveticus]QBL11009.1 hypothetical protein A0073_00200 [Campylobacter helveticus]TXK60927.1 hypothetical protein FVD16_00655 [Campylobacter helveticus]
MLPVLNQFLDFLGLNTSTKINNKSKNSKTEKNKESIEEIEDDIQVYQLIEENKIIKEQGVELEVKTITELIPQGNKKALKKTRQETHILRR